MKENKKFLEFADGHLEEIILYKKGERATIQIPLLLQKVGFI